ncbi:MAG: type II toxin-antitoxin system PemK/MazF family toxin [Acidimicrobiia bacterium]|nr:type II toxin-antitoxin system PemK/MazF family toxin [Acidimicrobiia bacterium]
MIQAGDIHLADLNDECRRRVLVMSRSQFHRLTGRVLVAPEIMGPPDEVPFPWRIRIDEAVYAVDLLRGLPTARLLERTSRAPETALVAARRALSNLT